jgi:hypothetical protein
MLIGWMSLAPSVLAQNLIYANGFEDAAQPACISGPVSGPSIGGIPAGSATTLLCFELREDLGIERTGEAAFGSVPIALETDLRDAQFDRLVVIGPGARQLPAQFRTIARWGAGLADTSAPVRWLQVSLRPDLPANASVTLALQRYAQPLATPDPGALIVAPLGQRFRVDTGLAEFEIDPANASLLVRAALRATAGGPLTTVYQYVAGAAGHGLDVSVSTNAGAPLIAAGNALPGSLVVDSFEWVDNGPIRAVAYLRGHLESGDNGDRCFGNNSLIAFPFAVTIAMTRGSRLLDYEWQFITACSDASGNNWGDEGVRIDALGWNWRLDTGTPASRQPVTAGSGAVSLRTAGSGDRFVVEQGRGGGMPWVRRAQVRNASQAIVFESAERFDNPLIGVLGSSVVASLSAPWLRFREPQGLEVEADRIALRMISQPSLVGEGKGLWFSARLALDPPGAPDPAALLETRRNQARGALERGLTPRARLEDLNASGVLAPLSGATTRPLGAGYLQYVTQLHDHLVRDVPCTDPEGFVGGQWTCAKTFGSQLWPDIQFETQFSFVENPSPNENFPRHDYWGASNAELTEYMRSGGPKWLWDFALPQVWLQVHTAFLNLGERNGTTRNGFAPDSGGSGDGLWHRNNGGSADYSYNMGYGLGYVLRPSAALRDRFGHMGASAINRLSNNPDDDTTWIAIGRFNVQTLRALMYCAQFVPGAAGTACDSAFRDALDYLATNSLSAGIPCANMLTANPNCFLGQTFMIVALFYPFIDEAHRLYGPTLSPATRAALRRTLIETVRVYRQYGIPSLPNGDPDPAGNWQSGMNCTLAGAGFTSVSNCVSANLPEPFLFAPNKPAATSLWFRSHALDPGDGRCAQGRAIATALFPDPTGAPLGPLVDYSRGGWTKASSLDAQNLAHAVSGDAECGP